MSDLKRLRMEYFCHHAAPGDVVSIEPPVANYVQALETALREARGEVARLKENACAECELPAEIDRLRSSYREAARRAAEDFHDTHSVQISMSKQCFVDAMEVRIISELAQGEGERCECRSPDRLYDPTTPSIECAQCGGIVPTPDSEGEPEYVPPLPVPEKVMEALAKAEELMDTPDSEGEGQSQ